MSRHGPNPGVEPSSIRRVAAQVGGLILIVVCLSSVATTDLDALWKRVLVWAAPLLTFPITRWGRRLLDEDPTQRRAHSVTVAVHYGVILALGTGLFPVFRSVMAQPVLTYPVLRQVVWAGVVVTGVATFLTVLNLALRGLGAPFAVKLSARLATDWLYARTRNPMLLATLAWLACLAVWHKAPWALVFLAISVTPGWLYFVRVYEERELEIRFEAAYREYRERTPFFWPRVRRRHA